VTTTNQPKVPNGIKIGDKVLFVTGVDEDEERHGVVLDILSTQFLINDANNVTFIASFKNVTPEK
jgi:acid phosphatase class B